MELLKTDNLVLLLVVLSKRAGSGEPRLLSLVSTVNPVICVCRFHLHRSGPALQGPQRPVCVRHKHVSDAHNGHPQFPCLLWQKSNDHEIITQRECLYTDLSVPLSNNVQSVSLCKWSSNVHSTSLCKWSLNVHSVSLCKWPRNVHGTSLCKWSNTCSNSKMCLWWNLNMYLILALTEVFLWCSLHVYRMFALMERWYTYDGVCTCKLFHIKGIYLWRSLYMYFISVPT